MKLKLFVVYDSKTDSWGVPFFKDFTANALREWAEVASEVSNKENKVAKYPGDFSLFEIGEYSMFDGQVHMYESRFNHGTALEHIKADPQYK